MASFHPPEKWVALEAWLQQVEETLSEWSKTKAEADRILK